MVNRRHVLLGGVALLGGVYVNSRGLRYPRLNFEPEALSPQVIDQHFSAKLDGAIENTAHVAHQGTSSALRAISPEPKILISINAASPINFTINNIAESATIKVTAAGIDLNEEVHGITRSIELKSNRSQDVLVEWFLSEQDGANFAVIGDTGAGLELEWCMARAQQLGADFLLHLGDFNYVDGEYERAIQLFHDAPLPCYVTIGNHDFNESGWIYEKFVRQIGPLNHSFSFAGTQFLNIDTALDFFPAHSGLRGEMLGCIESNKKRFFDHVCFTHRNFVDPRPGQDHTIGRAGERRWLADKLNDIGVKRVLTGHVHRSAESEYRGLEQYTVGEGMGFEDIVHEEKVAQLIMGRVEKGKEVTYKWESMNMPWKLHTSPEHEEKLIKEHSPAKLKWYRDMLSRHTASG